MLCVFLVLFVLKYHESGRFMNRPYRRDRTAGQPVGAHHDAPARQALGCPLYRGECAAPPVPLHAKKQQRMQMHPLLSVSKKPLTGIFDALCVSP